ncbi:protein EDS1L-like [Neltuma alba]|uniref:protein EDS1L-like n=1 Tax=Neltuma alba TaxID=207710 RepID=UPI0010A359E2|nr:protein EDS1L-like [Prosopis alba]
MAGGSASSVQSVVLNEDRINKALALSLKAHRSPEKPYLVEKIGSNSGPKKVIISFPGCGSVKDWYSETPFGESQINLSLFPSLKSVGNDEAALVNKSFLQRFEAILGKTSFTDVVEKAIGKKKEVIFSGHSSGAAVAILATLWALDKYLTPDNNQFPLLCFTFGSPLIGNHILSHATRREKWSNYFMHFIMKYDTLPRILLAPLSSWDQRFDPVLQFFNPKSKYFGNESVVAQSLTSEFYFNVMINAANATSHAACKLMGNTNAVSETLASFIALSPYRPFGTYIFCTGSGKLIIIRNPDAVLQLLFFSAQLNNEAEAPQIAYRFLKEHFMYADELKESLAMQNAVYLDQLETLLSSADGPHGDNAATNMALNDLGLSKRARLCLGAAGKLEKQKIGNEEQIDLEKAEKHMEELQQYKAINGRVSYYEAFKRQDYESDFLSNVNRLRLASVWDDIIEKLRNYELPDEFEGKPELVKCGTQYRRLVEPLDVANYYRHVRNDVTGPYMEGKGRPRRYKYTQRWLEHARRKPKGAYSESCLMAEVEELWIKTEQGTPFEQVKERVLRLEGDIKRWSDEEVLSNYVLLEGSTLVKLWNQLPNHHKERSCIRSLILKD